METSSWKRRIGILAAASAVASMSIPGAALADNGLQSGTQNYGSAAVSSSYAWNPASNNGEGGAGQIQLNYSTEGGTWQEPGADPTAPGDNIAHDNGSYVLTIPKLISYTAMHIGNVSTSDDYTVNLRGALEAGKVVNVSATASGSLENGGKAASDDSSVSFTTTRGKESWNATEAYGTLNADGSLSGTNATDNIAMSGMVKSAGAWTGHIQYLAEMVDAGSGGELEPAVVDYGTAVQSWDVGEVPGTVMATLYDSGALVVSGEGMMTRGMTLSNQPWASAEESVTTGIIENGVTNIAPNAFRNCSHLTSVSISDSVTNIAACAFYGCSNLASIDIPDGVTSIDGSAFYGCSNLASIDIPDSVSSIGYWAFHNCTSLTNVTLPDGDTSIGSYAFLNCSSLSSITIPAGITSMGSGTFQNCTALANVTFSEGVTSIGDLLFCNCDNLTSITIPASVTSIESSAFYDSGLTIINANFPEGSVAGAPWGADNATIYYSVSLPMSNYISGFSVDHSPDEPVVNPTTLSVEHGYNVPYSIYALYADGDGTAFCAKWRQGAQPVMGIEAATNADGTGSTYSFETPVYAGSTNGYSSVSFYRDGIASSLGLDPYADTPIYIRFLTYDSTGFIPGEVRSPWIELVCK